MIRRLSLYLILLGLALGLPDLGLADTYPLMNGDVLTGEPIAPDARGLVVRQADGSFSPRTAWTNFTEAALRKLAELPKAKPFVEPYLEEEDTAAEIAVLEIKPKSIARLPRLEPKAGLTALFHSPITLTLIIILYLANVYSGYEIAIFRNYPPAWVIIAAAVLPVIGQVIFLSLPTRLKPTDPGYEAPLEELPPAEAYVEETPAEAQAHAATAPVQAAVPTLPPPMVYVRGQTTFNRRFFETKLAGFMRIVPGEAERDMVIHIRSARGEHSGNHISRVLPNELQLQINKGGATADVTIPFTDIQEVQVRHKAS